MPTANHDTLETVEKLLGERRKISGWLDALTQRQGETSPTVFQRVHDDYTAKLDKVQAKLAAAADSVQTLAIDVAQRLTDREHSLAAKRDERAEAELRAAVGEYSEKEWDKRRTRFDDEIAAAATERDGLQEELGRLRSVLAEATGREPTPVMPAPAVEDDMPSPSMTSFEPGEEAEPIPEHIAFEPPVEAEPETAPTLVIHEQVLSNPDEPPSAKVETAMPLAPSFDELAFLDQVTKRPTPADTAPAAPPVRASIEEYAVPEPPLDYPDPMPEPRVSQEMTPPRESFFGRPTPRSSEAVKSLKCQECGTLNFPTEWYCERCGGELAAF